MGLKLTAEARGIRVSYLICCCEQGVHLQDSVIGWMDTWPRLCGKSLFWVRIWTLWQTKQWLVQQLGRLRGQGAFRQSLVPAFLEGMYC